MDEKQLEKDERPSQFVKDEIEEYEKEEDSAPPPAASWLDRGQAILHMQH
jgi:hypothetical protein